MQRFLSISAAARRLGLSVPSLRYHLMYGRVGDVENRTPTGQRLFLEADLQRIAAALGVTLREDGAPAAVVRRAEAEGERP
jgi:DNA-binding transcriptional MerR regulator